MAKEIEHKFLVDNKGWGKVKDTANGSVKIKQGYLSKANRLSIRVRLMLPHKKYILGADKGYVTIKGKMIGFTRDEFEYPVPVADAEQMMKMSSDVLTKVRYYWSDGEHHWFVDEYRGLNKGLIVAEIELTHEEEKFTKPSWCGKDITHDKRYSNSYLCHAEAPCIAKTKCPM